MSQYRLVNRSVRITACGLLLVAALLFRGGARAEDRDDGQPGSADRDALHAESAMGLPQFILESDVSYWHFSGMLDLADDVRF